MLDGGKAANSLGLMGRWALLAAALVVWITSGEGMFFLVSAGIVWRLFTKDKPAQEDWNIWINYVVLLAALGYILHLIPVDALKH